ncbi:hypothetical protein [Sphingobium subterraneum]|uniref:hypothetical protein n=1 Tax=Sphingobium subterraneum TaxID=627688 RepID=UPI00161F7133|nr:hypothetical protein [Sphingobium subterraneum]
MGPHSVQAQMEVQCAEKKATFALYNGTPETCRLFMEASRAKSGLLRAASGAAVLTKQWQNIVGLFNSLVGWNDKLNVWRLALHASELLGRKRTSYCRSLDILAAASTNISGG